MSEAGERAAKELVDSQRVELWESQQAYEDAKVALAAALAACAREEAKWWNGLFKTFSGAYRLAHMDERNERLAALERAAGERAGAKKTGQDWR